MNEVKENVVSGFKYVANVGVLAEEKLRGVRFNILDAVLHRDSVHRGAGQIIPASR
jgi:elongation factor 2